ncbi:hypothetical protein GCM10009739_00770 [Microbacterium ulmi]
MTVGVDESRKDDLTCRVDALGGVDLEACPDLHDRVVLDENVPDRDLTDRGIHREEMPAGDQQSSAHGQEVSDRWSDSRKGTKAQAGTPQKATLRVPIAFRT